MKKLIDAFKEAGFTKLIWLAIAVICLFFGEIVNGFIPGFAARFGYAALGIFVYININVIIKYYSDVIGAVGWPPEIDVDKIKAKKTNSEYYK